MKTFRSAAIVSGFAVGVAVLAGCSSDDGEAVKAPESVASTSTSVSVQESEPSTAPTSTSAPAPGAPADALTMTCSEFMTLDQAAKTSVAAEIIAGGRTKINENNTVLAAMLAETMCTHSPGQTVNDALGAPPA